MHIFDASFIVSYLDKTDSNYFSAQETLKNILNKSELIVFPRVTFLETLTVLHRITLNQASSAKEYEEILESTTQFHLKFNPKLEYNDGLDERIFNHATEIFCKHSKLVLSQGKKNQKTSFVDCYLVAFANIYHQNSQVPIKIVTFDKHFPPGKYTVVPKI